MQRTRHRAAGAQVHDPQPLDARRREGQQHAPALRRVLDAIDEALTDQPLDQRGRAREAHALVLRDRRDAAAGRPAQQHHHPQLGHRQPGRGVRPGPGPHPAHQPRHGVHHERGDILHVDAVRAIEGPAGGRVSDTSCHGWFVSRSICHPWTGRAPAARTITTGSELCTVHCSHRRHRSMRRCAIDRDRTVPGAGPRGDGSQITSMAGIGGG